MKPQNDPQKSAEAEGRIKKPRFKIEKLEERIAPCHRTDAHGRSHGPAYRGAHRAC